ncbi:MAG: DUF4129 domain-containing protein [Pseudomonadota bacterium]
MDRAMLWWRDVLNDLWDWAERLTGGEGGWLDRLARWLDGFGADGSSSNDWVLAVTQAVLWALVVLAVVLIAIQLWRRFGPLPSSGEVWAPVTLTSTEQRQLVQRLDHAQPERWAPLLFQDLCERLDRGGLLDATPAATNRQLAARARVSGPVQAAMLRLADAADRALFAGWSPDQSARERLLATHADVVSTVSAAAPTSATE